MKNSIILLVLIYLFTTNSLIAQHSVSTTILFNTNEMNLDEKDKQELEDLSESLLSANEYELQIVGHADQDGSNEFNLELSKQRAQSVENHLISLGIESKYIEIEYKGEAQLLSNSGNKSEKLKNRRVSILAKLYNYKNTRELVEQLDDNPLQTHQFNIGQDIDLTLKKGTKVKIPANAFCNLDGSEITKGAVQLSFKEAHNFIEMVDNHLFTQTSNDILETGGMIYVDAKVNNKEVRLRDKVNIELQLPKQKTKSGMEIFVGKEDKNGVIWEETGKKVTTVKDEPFIQVDLSEIYDYTSDIEEPKIFFNTKMQDYPHPLRKANPPSKRIYTPEEYEIAFKKYEDVMEAYNEYEEKRPDLILAWEAEVSTRSKMLNDHYHDVHEYKVNRRIEKMIELLKRRAKEESHLTLLNDLFGFLYEDIGNISFNQKFYTKSAFGRAMKDVSDRTRFSYQDFSKYNADFFCAKFKILIGNIRSDILQKKIEMGYEVSNTEIKKYVLSANNLGWINCDRFYKIANDKKTNIEFAAEEGDVEYYLVFKDIRSVIRPSINNNKVLFKSIPIGESVRLIAIKFDGSIPLMARKDFAISASPTNIDLDLSPTKIKQIRATLNNI